jgi:hypothetical protein
MRTYRDWLARDPRRAARALGEVRIANPLGEERSVTVYAIRPAP